MKESVDRAVPMGSYWRVTGTVGQVASSSLSSAQQSDELDHLYVSKRSTHRILSETTPRPYCPIPQPNSGGTDQISQRET